MATSIAVVIIGAALPFMPLGIFFGFLPPPAKFYFILAAMVVVYLFIVEAAKRRFYRWITARHAHSGASYSNSG